MCVYLCMRVCHRVCMGVCGGRAHVCVRACVNASGCVCMCARVCVQMTFRVRTPLHQRAFVTIHVPRPIIAWEGGAPAVPAAPVSSPAGKHACPMPTLVPVLACWRSAVIRTVTTGVCRCRDGFVMSGHSGVLEQVPLAASVLRLVERPLPTTSRLRPVRRLWQLQVLDLRRRQQLERQQARQRQRRCGHSLVTRTTWRASRATMC